MKVNKVSAFRVKRGLRRVSGAEPQVVGLTPQTTIGCKAGVMAICLLRETRGVETEKRRGWGSSLLPATLRRVAGKREEIIGVRTHGSACGATMG